MNRTTQTQTEPAYAIKARRPGASTFQFVTATRGLSRLRDDASVYEGDDAQADAARAAERMGRDFPHCDVRVVRF